MSLRTIWTGFSLAVQLAVEFAALNVMWWTAIFSVPGSKRSLEWGVGYLLGALPGVPLIGVLRSVGIEFPSVPLARNDYWMASLGVVSWAAVGYFAGWGYERVTKGRKGSEA